MSSSSYLGELLTTVAVWVILGLCTLVSFLLSDGDLWTIFTIGLAWGGGIVTRRAWDLLYVMEEENDIET